MKGKGILRRHIFRNFYLRDIATIFLVWGVLNLLNGTLIFFHEVFESLDTTNGDIIYFCIMGFVRYGTGFAALTLGLYLWTWSPELMALLRFLWKIFKQYNKDMKK